MRGRTKIVGSGVVAAAAAAGAYFLYGRKGAKNRKMIKGWVLRMKGDILERMEGLQEVNEEVYHRLVDNVAESYSKVKKVNSDELGHLVKELKSFWKDSRLAGKNSNGKKVVHRLKQKA